MKYALLVALFALIVILTYILMSKKSVESFQERAWDLSQTCVTKVSSPYNKYCMDTNLAYGPMTLNLGDRLSSPSGTTLLILKPEGNLVLMKYKPGGQLIQQWESATTNRNVDRAVMQTDGNFVIYDKSNRAIWYSNTYGNPNSNLQVKENGTLAIISKAGQIIWSVGTPSW